MQIDIRKVLLYLEEKFNMIYKKIETLNNSFSMCEIVTKNIGTEETVILKPHNSQNIIIKDIIISSVFDDNSVCEVKINFGLSYIIFVLTKEQPTLHINFSSGLLIKYNLPTTAKIETGCTNACVTLIYTNI
ncbi:hypothetical protein [Thermobrachium celere]|uniref:hypothetical protein n=1 Tax=Thermobrachium celere TaxID=53422 RepID=UPI0019405CDA|nr:hypothetical protein [Thermobrachium celere]GFR35419.1 hypothetical protein TCEA9_12310 [Thermobrachium celere]